MSNISKLWGCFACKRIYPEGKSPGKAGRTNLPLCPSCNSSAVTRNLDWLQERVTSDPKPPTAPD